MNIVIILVTIIIVFSDYHNFIDDYRNQVSDYCNYIPDYYNYISDYLAITFLFQIIEQQSLKVPISLRIILLLHIAIELEWVYK